jgi:hypothetical protein
MVNYDHDRLYNQANIVIRSSSIMHAHYRSYADTIVVVVTFLVLVECTRSIAGNCPLEGSSCIRQSISRCIIF